MLEITRAALSDAELFVSLEQFYLYDFSFYNKWAIDENGRYTGLPCFSEMWADENRVPLLMREDGELTGFALVKIVSAGAFEMEQFFIMRKFQRQHVGTVASIKIFDMFKGEWSVGQTARNRAGQAFWKRAIDTYTGSDFESAVQADGSVVQTFSNA